VDVDHARLDDGVAVAEVDFENPFIRVRTIITPPPTGRQPPARLVPAPRGTNGTVASLHGLHVGGGAHATILVVPALFP
jgi:hypothetical protein